MVENSQAMLVCVLLFSLIQHSFLSQHTIFSCFIFIRCKCNRRRRNDGAALGGIQQPTWTRQKAGAVEVQHKGKRSEGIHAFAFGTRERKQRMCGLSIQRWMTFDDNISLYRSKLSLIVGQSEILEIHTHMHKVGIESKAMLVVLRRLWNRRAKRKMKVYVGLLARLKWNVQVKDWCQKICRR